MGKAQLVRSGPELQTGDLTGGEAGRIAGIPDRPSLLRSRCAGSSVPSSIGDHGDELTVVAQVVFLDVPGNGRGQHCLRSRAQVMPDQAAELAPLVGDVVDRLAVLGPFRVAGGDGLGLRVGSAGVIVVVCPVAISMMCMYDSLIREILHGDDPGLVGRPVGDGPLARDFLEPPLEVGIERRGDVEVHVAAVAGVAAPGQELARGRPGRARVAALAVGDPPRLAAGCGPGERADNSRRPLRPC